MKPTPLKSIAFTQCVAAFEGGGMRGAAYAGVYNAATELGINFIGTVGASSGAIAAALIGAGVSVEDVQAEMRKNFATFLTDTAMPESVTARAIIASSTLLGGRLRDLTKLQYAQGIYSSVPIQKWIEGILQRQLPNAHTPVRFCDLPKPVAIIATDLLSQGPKIFSKKSTPYSSVAFAVRASCTIPFFFQPVAGEASLLVDGGVLSNLPVFLISELELDSDTPTLCFRLMSDRDSRVVQPKSGIELISAVVDTVLNGVTEVQLSSGQTRQIISISTSEIKATDFNLTERQITTLMSAGETAINEFVEHEQVLITRSLQIAPKTSLPGYREGLLEQTSQLISDSLDEIWIIAGNLSWFREIYITLLAASLKNRHIRLLCEKRDDANFKEAVKAAIALNIDVGETDMSLPVRGTIVSPVSEFMKMIAIEKYPEPHGLRYQLPDDKGILELIANWFDNMWANAQISNGDTKPILKPVSDAELISALAQGVPQYAELTISVETVSTDSLFPLPQYLESFKLSRVGQLGKLLKEYGLQNAARLPGSPWPITPPVVERLADNTMVIIDGAHSVYHSLYSLNQTEMRVVLVNNPQPNLPAGPFENWKHVQVISEKKSRAERYKSYDPSKFRPIREAFKSLAI